MSWPIRAALSVAAILALAGCWGGEASGPPPPLESMATRFVAGTQGAIESVIVDPLPVKAARLLPPDGGAIEALRIDRDRNLYSEDTGYGPNVALGAEGGSQSRMETGIGLGFPLFGGGDGGTRTTAMTTSRLQFQIPDMEAYRRDWQHWILHVEFDDGTSRRTIETLPPPPPR